MDNYILFEKILYEKGFTYLDIYNMAEKYYFVKFSSLERKENISKAVSILEKKIGSKKTFEFLDFVLHQ